MGAHPLNTIVAAPLFPGDHVEGFGLGWIEGVNHTHEVRVVAQPLEMTLKVRSSPLKLCVGAAHPPEIVGPAVIGGRVARDVVHLLVPRFTGDDGRAVGDALVEDGFGAVHGVHHQFDVLGVGRGQQLDADTVTLNRHGTVDVDDAVHEQQHVVSGCRNSKIFAHEQHIVPFTGPKHGFRRGRAVDR